MTESRPFAQTTEGVYQAIRKRIFENDLGNNKKINQNAIAEELGVSRTPVVKALHMLEVEGLVDSIPNRGFAVHETTLRELADIYTLRQCLEMVAATDAAEHATPEDFDKLESFFTPFVGRDTADWNEYVKANCNFHHMLISLCANVLIHRINETLQVMERAFAVGMIRPPKETLQEHLDIVAALRSRNPAQAQEAVRTHMETTKARLQNTTRHMRALGIDPLKLPARDIMHREYR